MLKNKPKTRVVHETTIRQYLYHHVFLGGQRSAALGAPPPVGQVFFLTLWDWRQCSPDFSSRLSVTCCPLALRISRRVHLGNLAFEPFWAHTSHTVIDLMEAWFSHQTRWFTSSFTYTCLTYHMKHDNTELLTCYISEPVYGCTINEISPSLHGRHLIYIYMSLLPPVFGKSIVYEFT